mgnify:CR=1 FL=1
MPSVFDLEDEHIDRFVSMALNEDLGHGDITTELLIPQNLHSEGKMIANSSGIIAGGKIARMVFRKISPSLEVKLYIEDGHKVAPGDTIATVSGITKDILKAERTALNFIQRLSGIATITARYVDEVTGLPSKIMDTRKTTPGLRVLEKYAVYKGGGNNHRFHLGESMLIKDNHLTALRKLGLSIKDVIRKAKDQSGNSTTVEIEVVNREEAVEAVQGGADIILLDNMSPDELKNILPVIPDHIITEASGGITIDNVRSIALTGVDRISIGALTHSVQSLDISLDLVAESITHTEY